MKIIARQQLEERNLVAEQAQARIAELEAALRKLEHVDMPYVYSSIPRCPVCGTPEFQGRQGHSWDTDCWLAALLKGGAS